MHTLIMKTIYFKEKNVSCLCVAVLVRPADWPAKAVLGQRLFIRIHREGREYCKK